MTDIVEEEILKIIGTLKAKLEIIEKRKLAAEEEIKTAHETIEIADKEVVEINESLEMFLGVIKALKLKKKNDCEALAALYISDKKDDDFGDFSNATGIGLGDEQEAEEEGSKEAPETG